MLDAMVFGGRDDEGWRRVLGGLLVGSVLAAAVPVLVPVLRHLRGHESPVVLASASDGKDSVTWVEAVLVDVPSVDVQPGDRVLAIDGRVLWWATSLHRGLHEGPVPPRSDLLYLTAARDRPDGDQVIPWTRVPWPWTRWLHVGASLVLVVSVGAVGHQALVFGRPGAWIAAACLAVLISHLLVRTGTLPHHWHVPSDDAPRPFTGVFTVLPLVFHPLGSTLALLGVARSTGVTPGREAALPWPCWFLLGSAVVAALGAAVTLAQPVDPPTPGRESLAWPALAGLTGLGAIGLLAWLPFGIVDTLRRRQQGLADPVLHQRLSRAMGLFVAAFVLLTGFVLWGVFVERPSPWPGLPLRRSSPSGLYGLVGLAVSLVVLVGFTRVLARSSMEVSS